MLDSFNNKRIAKNTVFLYIRMIVVLLVSLYTTRVVLNVLGVVDYGIYNVVAGFVTMFAFLNTSMINTIQRFYNYERGAGSFESLVQVYNTAIRIQIIISFVMFVALESFGLWYINRQMVIPLDRLFAANWVFQFSILSLILLVLQIPYSAAIVSHEKMNYFAIVTIIDAFLKLALAFLLPYISYDKLVFYGLFLFAISVIDFILYYIYTIHSFNEIKFIRHFKGGRFKEMLSFTGWNVLESLSYVLQGQGLNVLMNTFFGPVVNAARGVAFQVQSGINGFSLNIATAVRPQLVQSYAKKEFNRTQTLMFSMTKYGFLMLFILCVPISIELHYILNVWLNGNIPDHTLVFTYLVLVNMLINCLNMPITQTVLATGFVRTYQFVRCIINAAPLPVSWLFLRAGYDPTIVFWVTIVFSLINQPISMAILHYYFRFSYKHYLTKVLLPCFLLLITTPIIPYLLHLFMKESFIRLVVVTTVSLIVSFVIAYYLVLDKTERETVRVFVKKTLKLQKN